MEYYSINKKVQTLNTCNNIDESQKHYAGDKSQGKRDYTTCFHLYKILENKK